MRRGCLAPGAVASAVLTTVLGDPQLAQRGDVRRLSYPVIQETFVANAVERDRWTTIVTAGFYVVLGVYVAIAMTSALAGRLGKFDDALPLLHGMLIQQRGDVPNLDFYSFYPPLNLYLNAAVFGLFGRTVLASRMLSNACFLMVVLLVVWFYRARFRSWGPLVPVTALAVASSIGSAISLPLWPGFALSLSALLLHLRSQEAERYRLWLVAGAGVLTALALLSRINFGGYVVAVIGIDFLQRWWLDGRDRERFRLRSELTALGAFALPVIAVTVGFCAWVYGDQIGVALSEFIVTAQRVMTLRGFVRTGVCAGSCLWPRRAVLLLPFPAPARSRPADA